MRDYMNGQVTPPKRVTSPTWGPPPPCKQALSKIKDEASVLAGGCLRNFLVGVCRRDPGTLILSIPDLVQPNFANQY